MTNEERPASEAAQRFEAEEQAWSETEERTRKAAAWVTGAYAAIAGLLLTGIQLTALASAEGSVKGWALAAVGLTVTGALVVIVAHVSVLIAQAGSLRDIGRTSRRDSVKRLLGDPSPTLSKAYEDVLVPTIAAQVGVAQATVATLDNFLSYFDSRVAASATPALPATERKTLNLAMARIKNYLQLEAVRYKFRVARRWFVVGGLASAIGIVWFASLIAPADDESADAPSAEAGRARPVLIEPLSKGIEDLEVALGEGCVDDSIEAFMLSSSERTAEVVTLPQSGCPSIQLTLTTNDVLIRSACTDAVPQPTEPSEQLVPSPSPATTSTPLPEEEVRWIAVPC